jgi:hypothetical protein
MAHYHKRVLEDKKREQDEYDHEEFLKEKDELMGLYWLTDDEAS